MTLADPTHLLWIDLETTGFQPYDGEILEIAMIVTEPRYPFNEVAEYESVIRPMDLWLDTGLPGHEALPEFLHLPEPVAKMHLANGLLMQCFRQDRYVDDVQRWLLAQLTDELGIQKGSARLAGSGIGPFDVPWIRAHMPLLAGFVQYRPLDISSVRCFLQACGHTLEKGDSGHRAMEDARASLVEARRLAHLLGV